MRSYPRMWIVLDPNGEQTGYASVISINAVRHTVKHLFPGIDDFKTMQKWDDLEKLGYSLKHVRMDNLKRSKGKE